MTDAAIKAGLTGSTVCSARGITVRGSAPVFALCRGLIGAGYDPSRPLHVYRDGKLCLRLRSIGEGACLTVEDDRHGRPRFRSWRERGCGAAPPVAQIHGERGGGRSRRNAIREGAP
jgi:hypothetical protein